MSWGYSKQNYYAVVHLGDFDYALALILEQVEQISE